MRRTWAAVAAVTVAAALVGGCSSNNSSSDTTSGGTLSVFAASSLTETFTTLKADFERTHPGVQVVLSFNSSTTLADQITSGAPADVLATADQTSISGPQQAGRLAARPVQFATNTLTIVVPPTNPGHISGVADLQGADYVACDPSAPCGAAAVAMLENASITTKPKAYFPDVATVLTQIEQNEADAGIVYVTDAQAAADRVDAIAIPASDNVTNDYFIAAVKDSKQATLADAWIRLVTSPSGQAVLRKAGFGSP